MPTVEQLGLKVGDQAKWRSADRGLHQGEIIGLDEAVYVYPPDPENAVRDQDLGTGEIGIFHIGYDSARLPIFAPPHENARVIGAINKQYPGFIPLTRAQWFRSIIPATIDRVRLGVTDFFYDLRAQF